MDDDLEDEVFGHTLVTHMKLMSNLMTNVAAQYSPTVSLLSRQMRSHLAETVAMAVVFSLLAITYLGQSVKLEKLWCLEACKDLVNGCLEGCKDLVLSSLGLQQRVEQRTSTCPLKKSAKGMGGGGGGEKSGWEFKGKSVGVYAIQGRRAKMEDRFSVNEDTTQEMPAMYGVFDGHGGDFAAEFVEKKLFASFTSRVHKNGCETTNKSADEVEREAKSKEKQKEPCDYAQMLAEEILTIDRQLLEIMKASKDLAGTTALVALVHGGKLVVANVGDSRGVICDIRSNAIPLSFDHKPQQLKEQKRIKQAGGFVAFNGVWRVAGILATSRALGDYPLKDRNLIIADPDVLTFDLGDLGAQFMILASDGLWDAFTNEEAVAFVKKRLHEPDFGAKSLTMQAFQRGSLDNITVMVVTFAKTAAGK